MSDFWQRVGHRLTGVRQYRDLEDLIPDDIGITNGGAYWYVTARYDFGVDEQNYVDHEHVEIKMTPAQGRQLLAELREAEAACRDSS